MGGDSGPSQKAKTHHGPIRCLFAPMGAALSAARPRKVNPKAQSRSGHPALPYVPPDRTPRYHPSARTNARNPAARSPTKGGLPAAENTTRHRKRSATSNNGQDSTARTAKERPAPSSTTVPPRKMYQTRTPAESMILSE